jgi:hypothetical protein
MSPISLLTTWADTEEPSRRAADADVDRIFEVIAGAVS